MSVWNDDPFDTSTESLAILVRETLEGLEQDEWNQQYSWGFVLLSQRLEGAQETIYGPEHVFQAVTLGGNRLPLTPMLIRRLRSAPVLLNGLLKASLDAPDRLADVHSPLTSIRVMFHCSLPSLADERQLLLPLRMLIRATEQHSAVVVLARGCPPSWPV